MIGASRLSVILLLWWVLSTNLVSTVADDVRVGILGINTFGSVAYTEFLNRPRAEGDFAGVQVVAA